MEKFNKIIDKKKVIIWDFDGTIVNLDIDWNNLKKDILDLCDAHNLDCKNETRLNNILTILSNCGLKKQAFQIIDHYESRAQYKVIENTLKIINSLNDKIHCIFSDNLRNTILRILKNIGISDSFKSIISKEDVVNYKPDSDGLKMILNRFDEINHSEVLYIGDSLKDEKVAAECNVDFIKISELLQEPEMRVPFLDLKSQYNQIKEDIQKEINWVLDNTSFILGQKVKDLEDNFALFCGKKYAIAVNSGTSALHLALLVKGIGKGDEVITVPNTFIATAEAISYTGANPVFVDIDETYNIDVLKIEEKINGRTRAIIPVHLFGQPANMDPIIEIAKKHNLIIIEDCCQAHGAKYNEVKVPISDIGCFSFYPGKNLGAYGEGGIIVTDDDEVVRKCMLLRAHGEYPKNTHSVVGHNYRMDGIQGAIVNTKLKYLDTWTEQRVRNAEIYNRLLKGVVDIPRKVDYAKHVYHLYVIRVKKREKLAEFLKSRGIDTGIHYPKPIHLQEAYKELGYGEGSYPVAEKFAKEILSLPIYPELTEKQICYVANTVKKFYENT